MEPSLELLSLSQDLENIKAKELKFKNKRIAIEDKIIGLIDNDKLEGSVSLSNDDCSITVSNGVTRSCDFDKLKVLCNDLPEDLSLITLKPSLNLANLRVVEKTAGPNFKEQIADAITIKPRKTSVAFKRKL